MKSHKGQNFFDLKRKDFGSFIISNIPFSKKKEVLQRLKDLDIPFLVILPTATISTKFMRDIFKGEIQLLLPQKRIFYRKRFSYEDVKFSSSFESAFFCYKMNLPQDINYIKDDEETLNICDYLEQMIPLHTSNISNRVLELFKGTGSVGHVANEYGYEVISLDNEAEFEPTHLVDIMEWDYTVYSPGYFKVIHASVPCRRF